jgi:hypothetical protein
MIKVCVVMEDNKELGKRRGLEILNSLRIGQFSVKSLSNPDDKKLRNLLFSEEKIMKSSYRFLSQNGSCFLLAMIFTLSLVNTSEAYWGTGMYYANPACMVAGGGAPKLSSEAKSIVDDIKEYEKSKKELEKEVSRLKKEESKYKSNVSKFELGIKQTFEEKYHNFLFKHMRADPGPYSCCNYEEWGPTQKMQPAPEPAAGIRKKIVHFKI